MSASTIAVMALLRSRGRPGSQDTSQACSLPGAARAVWAVWSLVMVSSLMVSVMAAACWPVSGALRAGGLDVGGDAGAGGGLPFAGGACSRGCRAGRRRGRRRRTSCRRWRGGGRRWRRRARSGCARGRACPTRRRTGRSRRRGASVLTVGASPRTMARMVISRTPRARAMRAEPWPMTCRARSRSRVPPASRRARRRLPLVTLTRALLVAGVGWRRPEARSWTVAGARPAAAAMDR